MRNYGIIFSSGILNYEILTLNKKEPGFMVIIRPETGCAGYGFQGEMDFTINAILR